MNIKRHIDNNMSHLFLYGQKCLTRNLTSSGVENRPDLTIPCAGNRSPRSSEDGSISGLPLCVFFCIRPNSTTTKNISHHIIYVIKYWLLLYMYNHYVVIYNFIKIYCKFYTVGKWKQCINNCCIWLKLNVSQHTKY